MFRERSDSSEVFREEKAVISGVEKWSSIFDLQTKRGTLHKMILQKADAYFDLPNIDFSRWNTITPSIFSQSAESVNKRLERFEPEALALEQPVDAKIIDRTIRSVYKCFVNNCLQVLVVNRK